MKTAMQALKGLTKPALRYHGGKWRLAPWVIEAFPKHRVYVEPFGGGASVLLRKERAEYEVYNDIDSTVANVFRALRDNGDELATQVAFTPFSREEFALSLRVCKEPLEAARRCLVRSWMGFASGMKDNPSGFRRSAKREYTSPCDDWAMMPDALRGVVDRMQGVVIENTHALDIIRYYDSDDALFYIDPPYPEQTRKLNGRKRVYGVEMTIDQHRELARVLREVKGMVVLSSYRSELYFTELYPDWVRLEREGFSAGDGVKTEYLLLNRACAAGINAHPAQMCLLGD